MVSAGVGPWSGQQSVAGLGDVGPACLRVLGVSLGAELHKLVGSSSAKGAGNGSPTLGGFNLPCTSVTPQLPVQTRLAHTCVAIRTALGPLPGEMAGLGSGA